MQSVLLVSLATLTGQHFAFFQPLDPPRAVQVMAHRGMLRQAPENTRPALQRAIEEGIEWAEVDVRLSADGQHVLVHGSAVDGVTDGSGRVADLTLAQLQQLDAGSWFAPRYAGERLLSLRECLDTTAIGKSTSARRLHSLEITCYSATVLSTKRNASRPILYPCP